MILFVCYGSPHVNRFVAGVIGALRKEGVPAVTVALNQEARQELLREGLDPLPLFPQAPLGPSSEAAVSDAALRIAEGGEVPAPVCDVVGPDPPDRIGRPENRARGVNPRLSMALRSEVTAAQLLELIRPGALVLWNGWAPGTDPLRRRAAEAGVPTWFIERGPFPGTVQLDPEGINAGASFARLRSGDSAIESRRWAEEVVAGYRRSTASAWEQPDTIDEGRLLRRLGVDRSTRLVIFPCQVREDVNILRFASRLASYEEVYHWLRVAYAGRPGVVVIAKRHPKSDEGSEAFARALGSSGRWVEEVSIRQLLNVAHHVVSINSTVALEAMVHDRPAILLGSTFYAGIGAVDRGMAFTADGPEHLRLVVDRVLAGERSPNGTPRGVVDLLAGLHEAGRMAGADRLADHARAAEALKTSMRGAAPAPSREALAVLRELGELRCALQEAGWRRERARRSAAGRVLRYGRSIPGLRGLAQLLTGPEPAAHSLVGTRGGATRGSPEDDG